MTKKQHKSPNQTFWILLVIAALIVSLFYWYTSSGIQADEFAGGDALADTNPQPACSANFILAMDTTNTMRENLGSDTRLKASKTAATAFLDHIDAINAKNPEGVRSKVGLTTFEADAVHVAMSDDLDIVRTKIASLATKGGTDDGHTLSRALKKADELVRIGNTKPVRGTAYIIVISAARNNEDDENDERTAAQTAHDVKEKNIIIEGFGFKLAGETQGTGKLSSGDPENIVPNITSGDARYHTILNTAGGVTAMKAFAEKACPLTAAPTVATCNSNLDVAYLVENSTEFKSNDNRLDLANEIVTKGQTKLHAPDDRAALLTFSYNNPTTKDVVKQGFTAETAKATAAMKALKYTGNQSLTQGIGQGNKYIRSNQTVEEGKLRPTAVIVLTTPTSPLSQDAIDAAKRDFDKYGIRYFPVQIGQADANHFAKLQALATATGGQAFDLRANGTKAELAARAEETATAIFTKIDNNVANCVDVTLSVDKNNIKEGQTTNATYLVTNNSRSSIAAKMTQPLPAGLKQFVNGGAAAGNSVTLDLGTLAAGASASKSIPLIAAN